MFDIKNIIKKINLLIGNDTMFTDLCDQLIKCHSNLPICDVQTNLKTDIPDGGVDTQVNGVLQNDFSGYLTEKTIWQYRSGENGTFKKDDLKNKNHAYKQIENGYGYRLTLARCLTSSKKTPMEDEIYKHCREIDSNYNGTVKVLDANSLANWVSKYPGLCLSFFYPNYRALCITIDEALTPLNSVTSSYVEIENNKNVKLAIERHCDFKQNVESCIMPLYGAAGVGKTRLVCETIKNIPNAKFLALYFDTEDCIDKFINYLISDKNAKAIIIADECTPEFRCKLANKLQGFQDRIRLIAISNERIGSDSIAPGYIIMSPIHDLVRILQVNFPYVPQGTINLAASLSEGFVRFAIDICKKNDLSQIHNLSSIEEYYNWRLKDNEKQAIEAIALLSHVGYQSDVCNEINLLCDFLKLPKNEVLSCIKNMHISPGFVGKGGRYCYVTPEIIAKLAFKKAYINWIADNPSNFIKKIPQKLHNKFLKRVSQCDDEEIKKNITNCFYEIVASMDIKKLTDINEALFVIKLIMANPDQYLSILKKKITQASDEDVRAIKGGWINGDYGPRRHLVFLCEKLVSFKEYFHDTEKILRKLAINEVEDNIANNATGEWLRLFRIDGSGTEMPYKERFDILKKCIENGNKAERKLAFRAFDAILSLPGYSSKKEPTFGGRIVPSEWQVKDINEVIECRNLAIEYLFDLASKSDYCKTLQAVEFIINNLSFLLKIGFLGRLEQLFSDEDNVKTILTIHKKIEQCLKYNKATEKNREYLYNIRQWSNSLQEKLNTHDKIMLIIGINPWDNKKSRHDVKEVAKQIYNDRKLLEDKAEWLFSPEAKLAYELGVEIGFLDREGIYIEFMLEKALDNEIFNLSCGYLNGLLNNNNRFCEMINIKLDKWVRYYPLSRPI